jgi:hypothetical protein
MNRKSTSPIGAFHPVLFFLFVYGISLFLAIFVCRTVYNSLNNDGSAQIDLTAPALESTAKATALR